MAICTPVPRSGYRTDAVATSAQDAPEGTAVRLAGRVVLWRRMGGLIPRSRDPHPAGGSIRGGRATVRDPTRHNALGKAFYLLLADLAGNDAKRVVVGSLECIYELGRNLRNEGMDSSHFQEFTMLEWYTADWDYRDNMTFIRELILAVLDEVLGTRAVTYGGVKLDAASGDLSR